MLWGPSFRDISFLSLLVITGAVIAFCVALTTAGDGGGGGEEVEDGEDKISHGLGSHIAWVKFDEGMIQAKQEDKPLLLIIHKSWCGACRALKPLIKESKEIGELSKQFVMVNTLDEEEPPEELYRPDGGYIPRILFFNPKGELLKDVINEGGNSKYKYYYYDVDSIMDSMKKVVSMFQTPADIIDHSHSQNAEQEDPAAVETESESTNEKTEL